MDRLSTYLTKHKYSLRKGFFAVGLAGLCGMGFYGLQKQPKQQIKEQPKDSVVILNNPLIDISYRTDTLEHKGTALLYHNYKGITRNYVENENLYVLDLALFVHEWWHSQNNELRFRRHLMSPYEYYKISMHNEISANLAAILTVRMEYLAADDKAAVLQKYENSYLKFYIDAIKQKRINPEDYSKSAQDKEWYLLANGTRDMWMRKFANHYSPSMHLYLQSYYNLFGDKFWVKNRDTGNYQRLCNKMYTIGGVNFWKYMDKDITTKDDKVLIAEELRKVKSLSAGGRKMIQYIEDDITLLNDIGIEKQSEAFQNMLIADKLKSMLDNTKKEKLEKYPGLIAVFYNKIQNEIRHDKKYTQMVKMFPNISNNRGRLHNDKAKYAEAIQKLYTYKGIDLTAYLTDFSAENVPVKNSLEHKNNNYDWHLSVPAMFLKDDAVFADMMTEMISDRNIKSPYIVPLYLKAPQQIPEPPKIIPPKPRKSRLSAPQFITIPNWKQPILLAKPEQAKTVFACMHDFINMPKVLKLCNTEDQRAYWVERDSVDIGKTFLQKQNQKQQQSQPFYKRFSLFNVR